MRPAFDEWVERVSNTMDKLSFLMTDIAANQKKIVKAIKELDEKYEKLESIHKSLSKIEILSSEPSTKQFKLGSTEVKDDLVSIQKGLEKICEIDENFKRMISQYNMNDTSNENLKKQSCLKDIIKKEIHSHAGFLNAIKKLEENFLVMQKFSCALVSQEKPKEAFAKDHYAAICFDNHSTTNTDYYEHYGTGKFQLRLKIFIRREYLN